LLPPGALGICAMLLSLQFLDLRHFVGVLVWGISPSQGRYPHRREQRINADKRPHLEWDSNPWSQYPSGWRHFMP
jgi:hypothetical protein